MKSVELQNDKKTAPKWGCFHIILLLIQTDLNTA